MFFYPDVHRNYQSSSPSFQVLFVYSTSLQTINIVFAFNMCLIFRSLEIVAYYHIQIVFTFNRCLKKSITFNKRKSHAHSKRIFLVYIYLINSHFTCHQIGELHELARRVTRTWMLSYARAMLYIVLTENVLLILKFIYEYPEMN